VRIRWILAVAPLVVLLGATPAFGATANVTNFNGKITAIYNAGSGEVNHVTATVSGGVVTFTDPGMNMAGGNGCTTPGTNTITCRNDPPIEGMRISLGEEADYAKNDSALPSSIFGGQLPSDLDDTIYGGSGPDFLTGHRGSDTIYGNGQNDEIHGGSEGDTLYGNGGKDDITGDDDGDSKGPNTLVGGTGDDTLVSSELQQSGFANTVSGGDGDDSLYGAGGADVLDGGIGNDFLDPSEDNGADVLNGGPDADTASYLDNNSNWAVRVSLDNIANDGPKSLTKNDNVKSDIETVRGSPFDDLLIGTSGKQTLKGYSGNDVLDGGIGPDDLFGGSGDTDAVTYENRATKVTATINGVANDGVVGENDNVKTDVENLIGGDHNDKLSGDGDTNQLFGGDGGDELNGLGGPDTLNGEGSNDTFIPSAGADNMIGGVGIDTGDYSARIAPQSLTLDALPNDGSAAEGDNLKAEQVFGGSGADVIVGDADSNFLEGRGDGDTISAAEGVDFIDGGNGVDTIGAGDGDDFINNGTAADGADTVAGGTGIDLSSYQNRSNALNVSLDDVADDGETGENDDVRTTVEKVTGGAGPDTLNGSAENNVLSGGGAGDTIAASAGDDTVNGNAGVDMLFGGDNNDTLQGGTGADVMGGGPGIDTADYAEAGTGIDVTIDDVANDGIPAEGDNVNTTIEKVFGGRFNDTIQGNGSANGLRGQLGMDLLQGAGGADTITGGNGQDDLRGGTGPDELHAVDATADSVLCGPEVDSYAADGIDTVAADCENAL
jgi:Ca2+-binding RTX toxin-like protein